MRALRLLCPLLIGALLVGCAGYRVGPTNGIEARSKSITIRPFANETMEPRLTQAVSTALRRVVQRDGTYQLETQTAGDIVVEGKITKYDRTALTLDPLDVLSVRDMEIYLIAHVIATDTASGRVLVDKDVWGRTTLRVTDNFASSERQAAPLLAEDLARNITSLLTDGDW